MFYLQNKFDFLLKLLYICRNKTNFFIYKKEIDMDSTKLESQKYTYEEYLELELNSEVKHEYYYGEVFAMAGTTLVHNEIVFNTTSILKNKLRNKDEKCSVYFESVKTQITKKSHYTYPDVVVRCDQTEDDNLTITKPVIIIEVLSESTRKYDSGQKFTFYKQIPSLKYYILVEQNYCLITCYTRENDFWYHQVYTKLDETIKLEHLQVEIPVKDIYDQIVFES